MSTSSKGKSNRRTFTGDERLHILQEGEEFGVKKTCERHQIHFTTWYEWRRKYQEYGQAGLETKKPPRKGRRSQNIEPWKEEVVLKECKQNPGFGPSQIVNQLRRQRIAISIRTVTTIMKRHGYEGRKKTEPKCRQRFEASRPLELAQIDILEFYIHKAKVYLALLLDDFSRFLLGYALLDSPSTEPIAEMVKASVQRYGKMETVLADRGSVFFSWQGMTRFEKYLDSEGILMTHASPGHPQTLGKLEAVNKNIQKELIRVREFKDLSEAEHAIGDWIEGYNYRRTHQGLGGLLVPADRFHGRAESARQAVLEGISKPATGEPAPNAPASHLNWPLEDGIAGRSAAAIFQIRTGPNGLEVWLLGERLWPPSIAEPPSSQTK